MDNFKDDNVDPKRRTIFSGLALSVGAAMLIPTEEHLRKHKLACLSTPILALRERS